MKNKMKQQLNRELDGIRVSDNLKERILAEAVASRAPSRRRSYSIRPLAIAAAVMVVCGLTAGMIALRQEKPDLHATPLSAANSNQATWVWVGNDGFYHGASSCGDQQNMSRIKVENARAEGRKACSACIESGSAIADDLVWMNDFGGYYHSVKDCSGMEGAFGVLEIEAKTLGRAACPACFDGVPVIEITPMPTFGFPVPLNGETAVQLPEETWTPTTPEPTPTPMATVEPMQMAQSTPVVTAEPTPSPMAFDATQTPWATAAATVEPVQMAQSTPTPSPMATVEPTQMPVSETFDAEEMSVWMTKGGLYYHADEHCSGMENALQVMESEAQASGKQTCPVCLTIEAGPVSEVFDSDAAVNEEMFVWATENGVFYHTNEHCSGMNGAEYIAKNEAIESGKMRCAVCMKNTVWVSDENVYYHIARYCSGMKDAVTVSEQEALDVNLLPCPGCIGENEVEETATDAVSDSVWVHPDDELYYHSDAYCGSTIFTVAEARGQSKAACAVCAENAEEDDFVWMNHDNHFHLDKYCTERPFYVSCSESDAIESGRMPCLLCMNGEAEAADLDCVAWTAEHGELYHRAQNCSGMVDARQTSKKGAENEGKQPCSVCIGEIPVWIEDGAYYHMRKGCSGVDTPAQVAKSVAEKDGKQACPICYTEEELIPWRTEVWITEDYFYHADEQCSEVVMLSDYKECCLEAAAIEWGKLPCETCLSQRYEVPEEPEGLWMTDGGVYYHTKRRCMGIVNAHSCTIEEALACGKQPCPSCAKQIPYNDSDAVTETETAHHAESEEHHEHH